MIYGTKQTEAEFFGGISGPSDPCLQTDLQITPDVNPSVNDRQIPLPITIPVIASTTTKRTSGHLSVSEEWQSRL